MASTDEKPKKFVAPGSAGRAPKMAPTAFHASPTPHQPQGESDAERLPAGRYQVKFNSSQQRPPGDGEADENRRRYVPRHTQPARYNAPQHQQPGGSEDQPNQQHVNHQQHPRRAQYNQSYERHGATNDTHPESRPFTRSAPRNPTIHKLRRPYTFSVYRRPVSHVQDGESYEKSIKTIGGFDTVEGFWAFYSHIERPGELTGINADYHLFCEGIAPVWEHEVNRMGGKFSIRLKKGAVNRVWEDLLLAFVGDQFDYADDVCGVVASMRHKDADRKRDLVAVWIRDTNRPHVKQRLEEQLRSLLELADSTEVEYKPHSVSLQDLKPSRAEDGGAD